MSGSMALAAARRRRVNVIDTPPPPPTPRRVNEQVQSNDNKIMVSPLTIMKQHHNEILNIKEEIKSIKDTSETFNYKEGYNTLLKDITDMKKTMVKLQSFILDTDNEIKKLKENKLNRENENDDDDDLSKND